MRIHRRGKLGSRVNSSHTGRTFHLAFREKVHMPGRVGPRPQLTRWLPSPLLAVFEVSVSLPSHCRSRRTSHKLPDPSSGIEADSSEGRHPGLGGRACVSKQLSTPSPYVENSLLTSHCVDPFGCILRFTRQVSTHCLQKKTAAHDHSTAEHSWLYHHHGSRQSQEIGPVRTPLFTRQGKWLVTGIWTTPQEPTALLHKAFSAGLKYSRESSHCRFAHRRSRLLFPLQKSSVPVALQ